MVKKRFELPEVGDLVVGTVKEIFEYGAYVSLDEYGNLVAYLPRGEVSSRWVRNIRDYLREGGKAVFKVIRVNRRNKQVDLSLRRVSDSERRSKMIEWKRAQKAHKILEIAASYLNKTIDSAYEEAGWKLEDYYGEIYAGLEEAVSKGIEALIEAGLPEEWAEVLKKLADKYIEIKRVKISGIMVLQTASPNGVEEIKATLMEAYNQRLPDNCKMKIYTIGSPRYRIDIEAEDYKTAERVMKKIVDSVLRKAKNMKIKASYQRIERR